MAYTKSSDELALALGRQVSALKSSCRAFDAGDEWEGARIAAVVHILVHEGGKTSSLLRQLGVKDDLQFVSSGSPVNADNHMPSHPLVSVRGDMNGAKYVPLILAPFPVATREFKFKKWWKGPVFAASRAKWTLSRADLISSLRNQDGGGHLDKSLTDEKYVEFSRSPHWFAKMANGSPVALMGLEMASARQIGWEVLTTLERAGLG